MQSRRRDNFVMLYQTITPNKQDYMDFQEADLEDNHNTLLYKSHVKQRKNNTNNCHKILKTWTSRKKGNRDGCYRNGFPNMRPQTACSHYNAQSISAKRDVFFMVKKLQTGTAFHFVQWNIVNILQ